MYRHITLMLEKQHNIRNQRSLKRRLKDYGLKRCETLEDTNEIWFLQLLKAGFYLKNAFFVTCNSSSFLNHNKLYISEKLLALRL